MGLRLLPKAGGVNQSEIPIVPAEERVDGVARRARRVGDQGTFLTEKRVDQRTLADVGPADHGQREFVANLRCGRARRQTLDNAIEEIAGPLTVNRRNGNRLAEAE